jgi:hypothetical protein
MSVNPNGDEVVGLVQRHLRGTNLRAYHHEDAKFAEKNSGKTSCSSCLCGELISLLTFY